MTKKRTDGMMDWILTGIFTALAARGTKKLVTADRTEDAATKDKPRRAINTRVMLFVIGCGIFSVTGFTGKLDQYASGWDKDASFLRLVSLLLSMMVCWFVYAILINPTDKWGIRIVVCITCWVIALALWEGTTYDNDPLKVMAVANAALIAVSLTGAAIMYCLGRVIDALFFS